MVHTFETRHRRKDGRIVPVEVTNNFVEVDGKEYVCSFVRDITERKRGEEARKKTLKEVKNLKNQLQAENIYLQKEIKLIHNFEEIITRSDAMNSVLRSVEQVATTDATVLVLGETGTGKELLARAIHNISVRRNRPLVKVSCAALQRILLKVNFSDMKRELLRGPCPAKLDGLNWLMAGLFFWMRLARCPQNYR
jgi:transcriptional regulator with GAF, ATPase, and Fis domain